MSYKYYVITPVRNVGIEFKEAVNELVAKAETDGHKVHYPPRDTFQIDETGLDICDANLKAIQEADAVVITWDGKSTGSLFDLGMAFALDKPVIPMRDLMPAHTEGKSFQNMIAALADRQFEEAEQAALEELANETNRQYLTGLDDLDVSEDIEA